MTYKLKYNLTWETGEFTKEQIEKMIVSEGLKAGVGATDALIVISCISQEGGGYSQWVMSVDGRKSKGGGKKTPKLESMSPDDLFKAWVLMGSSLAEQAALDPNKRAIADMPGSIINSFIPAKGPVQ